MSVPGQLQQPDFMEYHRIHLKKHNDDERQHLQTGNCWTQHGHYLTLATSYGPHTRKIEVRISKRIESEGPLPGISDEELISNNTDMLDLILAHYRLPRSEPASLAEEKVFLSKFEEIMKVSTG